MQHQRQRYRFVIAGIILFFNLAYGINFAAVAPIFTLVMEEYGVSRGEASFLISGVIIVQGVLIIPGGMLVARSPLKLVYALGCLLAGAMTLAVLADHFLVLLALRMVYGLAFVVVMPATAPILMRWFSASDLPLINSLHMTFFTLGIGVGTFTAAPLSLWIGWQPTLSGFGAALVAAGLAWVLFARIPPPAGQGVVRGVSLRSMWRLMRSKIVLLLGLADGAAFAQYVALTTWLPTYYNEVFGMSLTKAGSTVGLIPMVGVCASMVGGVLSARLGVRKPFIIIPGLMVGFAGLGSFLFHNEAVIYGSMVMLGVTSFFYLPILLTIPMELKGTTEGNVVVAWATMFAIASSITIISPITVGFMTDALGSYIPAFTLWAVFSWGLLLAGLMLPETGPGRRKSFSKESSC